MKKFLLCSLMAFCLTLTASASTIGYEPPKVGVELPDIGFAVPVMDVVEYAVVNYEMMTAPVQVITDAADAPLFAVKVCPLFSMVKVPTVTSAGNYIRLCNHPPVTIGLNCKNLINVPKPSSMRVSNTFRQRSQNLACSYITSGYRHHSYNYLN